MNLATVFVATIIAAVFVAIVVAAIRNHKHGKSSCGCGGDCSRCSHCGH